MANKKKSPGIGHNGDLPAAEAYQLALAKRVLMQEEADKMKERHKRIRKGIEKTGVQLPEVDELFKLKDMTENEVVQFFKRKMNAFAGIFTGLQQFDLFAEKPNSPERASAYKHMGRMAALQGKENQPPPTAGGADLTDWQDGYNEGVQYRDQGKQDLADILADALENAEAGITTDGTGKAKPGRKAKEPDAPKISAAAAAVGAQAKADFERDQAAEAEKNAKPSDDK